MSCGDYVGTDLVNYSTSGFYSGGTNLTADNFCNYWPNYWINYYPSYHICSKSKIEQAFQIIGKIMELKIIDKALNFSAR